MVLSYFLGRWDTTPPPQKKKNNCFRQLLHKKWQHQKYLIFFIFFFKLPLGAKPLEARGEAASIIEKPYKDFYLYLFLKESQYLILVPLISFFSRLIFQTQIEKNIQGGNHPPLAEQFLNSFIKKHTNKHTDKMESITSGKIKDRQADFCNYKVALPQKIKRIFIFNQNIINIH